jgi:hypothetical protein
MTGLCSQGKWFFSQSSEFSPLLPHRNMSITPNEPGFLLAVSGACRWKTAISTCIQDQANITNANCGINGVPDDIGANRVIYLDSVTTTGNAIITITSTDRDLNNNLLMIVMTPSMESSSQCWSLSGNGCTTVRRSKNARAPAPVFSFLQ